MAQLFPSQSIPTSPTRLDLQPQVSVRRPLIRLCKPCPNWEGGAVPPIFKELRHQPHPISFIHPLKHLVIFCPLDRQDEDNPELLAHDSYALIVASLSGFSAVSASATQFCHINPSKTTDLGFALTSSQNSSTETKDLSLHISARFLAQEKDGQL